MNIENFIKNEKVIYYSLSEIITFIKTLDGKELYEKFGFKTKASFYKFIDAIFTKRNSNLSIKEYIQECEEIYPGETVKRTFVSRTEQFDYMMQNISNQMEYWKELTEEQKVQFNNYKKDRQ